MFGFGKRNPKEESPQGEPGTPIISAVLTKTETYPLAALKSAVEKSKFAGIAATEVAIDQNILTFQLDDELVAIAPMPAPYPWSDLEGPCATSWMWPPETPATTLKDHGAHMLITMMGGQRPPIERRLALTKITALAAQPPVVAGVYWPEATHVHFPKVFIEMAKEIASPEAPPLYLWVDYRVFKNEDGTTGMFTTGLAAIGFMEIEIPSIDMPPGELREWAVNITFYLIENGPVLKHGETLGVDEDHHMKIRHTTSLFGHEGAVIRLLS